MKNQQENKDAIETLFSSMMEEETVEIDLSSKEKRQDFIQECLQKALKAQGK